MRVSDNAQPQKDMALQLLRPFFEWPERVVYFSDLPLELLQFFPTTVDCLVTFLNAIQPWCLYKIAVQDTPETMQERTLYIGFAYQDTNIIGISYSCIAPNGDRIEKQTITFEDHLNTQEWLTFLQTLKNEKNPAAQQTALEAFLKEQFLTDYHLLTILKITSMRNHTLLLNPRRSAQQAIFLFFSIVKLYGFYQFDQYDDNCIEQTEEINDILAQCRAYILSSQTDYETLSRIFNIIAELRYKQTDKALLDRVFQLSPIKRTQFYSILSDVKKKRFYSLGCFFISDFKCDGTVSKELMRTFCDTTINDEQKNQRIAQLERLCYFWSSEHTKNPLSQEEINTVLTVLIRTSDDGLSVNRKAINDQVKKVSTDVDKSKIIALQTQIQTKLSSELIKEFQRFIVNNFPSSLTDENKETIRHIIGLFNPTHTENFRQSTSEERTILNIIELHKKLNLQLFQNKGEIYAEVRKYVAQQQSSNDNNFLQLHFSDRTIDPFYRLFLIQFREFESIFNCVVPTAPVIPPLDLSKLNEDTIKPRADAANSSTRSSEHNTEHLEHNQASQARFFPGQSQQPKKNKQSGCGCPGFRETCVMM